MGVLREEGAAGIAEEDKGEAQMHGDDYCISAPKSFEDTPHYSTGKGMLFTDTAASDEQAESLKKERNSIRDVIKEVNQDGIASESVNLFGRRSEMMMLKQQLWGTERKGEAKGEQQKKVTDDPSSSDHGTEKQNKGGE